MATLARGGRLNIFGFVLRLAAPVPFLFIGGRIYGAEAARPLRLCSADGRVRCSDRKPRPAPRTCPTIGRREKTAGLRGRRRNADRDHGAALGMAILFVFPKAMYPTTAVHGLDRLLASLSSRSA